MSNSVMDITAQESFYDERFKGFTFANRLRLARAVSVLGALASTKLLHPKIIDLGCGAGWLTNIVGMFGPTTGVELSSESVREARGRYPHVKFEHANIFEWDYPREEFDVVISQEVLEHVADQLRYLEIAFHLLKPGGYLILTTPNAPTLYAMAEKDWRAWTNQPIEDWRSPRELSQLLERRFNVLDISTIILNYGVKGSYRFINSARLRALISIIGLGRFFDLLRAKFGYGLHIVALAQKEK